MGKSRTESEKGFYNVYLESLSFLEIFSVEGTPNEEMSCI